MTLRHVVTWQLATSDANERAEQSARVVQLLTALEGVVPSIRALSAGTESLAPGSNWDVALVADFDDAAGLDAYQTHPEHLAAAAYIKSVVGARSAVDFEV